MSNMQLDHSQHQSKLIKYPICFLAHNIDLPSNIGSFFRIADALGVEKIYLTGHSVTPPHPKIKKTSRSTEQFVDYIYHLNPLQVIERLKNDGYTIVSLEITSNSISVDDLTLPKGQKVCLILGSEKLGVAQELLDQSSISIHIPMVGQNSSMNVASACSIATYEIIKGYK